MTDVRFRPMDRWPGDLRRSRQAGQFSASRASTTDVLQREVGALGGRLVVMELAVEPSAIRQDGYMRSGFRAPEHPGVIVSFDSRHGSLRYWTDKFSRWEHNLRGIALGLEALRKIDRYGIGDSGEQYRGWQALGSGAPMPAAGPMTAQEAAEYLAEQSGFLPDPRVLLTSAQYVGETYREAAKSLHPDVDGGDTVKFQRLTEAKRVLNQHHRESVG